MTHTPLTTACFAAQTQDLVVVRVKVVLQVVQVVEFVQLIQFGEHLRQLFCLSLY